VSRRRCCDVPRADDDELRVAHRDDYIPTYTHLVRCERVEAKIKHNDAVKRLPSGKPGKNRCCRRVKADAWLAKSLLPQLLGDEAPDLRNLFLSKLVCQAPANGDEHLISSKHSRVESTRDG
jgi:hypothetical protein